MTLHHEAAPRGMTAAELKRARDRLGVIQTNCGHCEHFELGRCDLHGEVPLSFQKTEGQCEDWRYDGVPF